MRVTVTEHRACDARCMYAVGAECSCSCGGANHGRGNGVNGAALALTTDGGTPATAATRRAAWSAHGAPARPARCGQGLGVQQESFLLDLF